MADLGQGGLRLPPFTVLLYLIKLSTYILPVESITFGVPLFALAFITAMDERSFSSSRPLS